MTEIDWNEESEPRKKRGIPKWVWIGCGVGCLGVLLIVAVMAFFGVRFVQQGTDPEVQWPKLEQVVAFDERPEGLDLTFGSSTFGFRQFVLVDREHGAMVTVHSNNPQFEQQFDPEFHGLAGLGAPVDPELTEITVQGRKVRALRYTKIKPEPEEGTGPGVRLDVTGDGEQNRMIELRHLRGEEPLSEEQIAEILAPFDLWRDR